MPNDEICIVPIYLLSVIILAILKRNRTDATLHQSYLLQPRAAIGETGSAAMPGSFSLGFHTMIL